MNTFAAVMTGKGVGAIAAIQIFGESAQKLLGKIFTPVGKGPAKFKRGQVLLGTIVDSTETIDQVAIGCEGKNTYTINCHGNPLIVADIMRLLGREGVTLLDAEELLAKVLTARKGVTAIEIEAKLAQLKAKTLAGAKIIANQVRAGLNKRASQWLEGIKAVSLGEIKSQAREILERSQTAKLIIYGCTAVIAGPPNSGKSTLLNCLAGRQKAIVTDIKGTTRDWVSARCRIGPVCVELIDTAGLDEELGTKADAIKKASQGKTVELLEEADLVLLVLDSSQTAEQLEGPSQFDSGQLPESLSRTVQISAKLGIGIDELIEKMQQLLGVADFDLGSSVCFTIRQQKLLEQLKNAESKTQVITIIKNLCTKPKQAGN